METRNAAVARSTPAARVGRWCHIAPAFIESTMKLAFVAVSRRVTIVAIVAGAMLLADCRAVSRRLFRQPTVALRNVAVDGIELTGGSLRVALLVRNPNFYSLSTAGMRYQ